MRLGFLTHVQGTYSDAQDLFVAADELGFDSGWVAQHHLPNGGGGLSSPWTFLSYAAARTRRIRLSTAITILPLEHPLRLAEDVSTVDRLSGGRVEIGVGSGSVAAEYEAFGVDHERRRELTTEHFTALRRALAGEGFVIQPTPGDFTDRVWQAVFSAGGAGFAASAGANLLLNRATYGYEEPTDVVQRGWADAYLDAWTLPRKPRIGLSRLIFPAKDRRTALAHISDGVLTAGEGFIKRGTFPAGLSLDDLLYRFHAFIGHPDEIVEALLKEKVLPVATDLIAQFNPGVPDRDASLRALELIATEVAPALGWKESVA
jgi:alkanesulfonate monooxygenase SsuD/methylene tetrahydromethanopterin reductase-like flavin-dependent oxidoreductase (luciferase family)